MSATVRTKALLLALLAAACASPAQAASPLTPDTLRAGLRTANPDEEAYLTYVATLLSQGRLPRDLVEGTFQWARRKPYPKKVEYFKHALITRAADLGITLPQGTPALTGTIQGRVFLRVLLADVPAPNMTVIIDGTRFQTVTNANGQFTFTSVPLGTYTLRVTGVMALLARNASAQVMLPSQPPSNDSVFVDIPLK